MNYKSKVIILIFFVNLIFNFNLYSYFKIQSNIKLEIPSYKIFKNNFEFTKDIKYKKITIAEYFIDPLIMYGVLWSCMGISLPMWEDNKPDIIQGEDAGSIFSERLKIEPFATQRISKVLVPLRDLSNNIIYDSNGNTVMRFVGDIYAKNILEPSFFTYLTLFLRSKNYHPAIIVLELCILSALYEFTIRPFFTYASFEQLIKNPSIGIVLGLFLDEISNYLLTTPFTILHILAYILNPFNIIPGKRIKTLLLFENYKQAVSIESIIKL